MYDLDENHPSRRERQRTSVYLVLRAEALLGALQFFKNEVGDTTHRRLQFLAQSDFWEWEVENLIYSFTNLAERQQTWSSTTRAVQKLGQLGIAVDAKLVQKVKWRGRWRMEGANRRVAPVDLLKEVVATWNWLVDVVERQFVTPMQDKARRWNIQTRPHLDHLRKTMPAFELDEED